MGMETEVTLGPESWWALNGNFPSGSDSKESACCAGDLGSIPGLGRSPGGGHGNPLQYSYLDNPHGQVHRVTRSWTCLSD